MYGYLLFTSGSHFCNRGSKKPQQNFRTLRGTWCQNELRAGVLNHHLHSFKHTKNRFGQQVTVPLTSSVEDNNYEKSADEQNGLAAGFPGFQLAVTLCVRESTHIHGCSHRSGKPWSQVTGRGSMAGGICWVVSNYWRVGFFFFFFSEPAYKNHLTF